MEESLVKKIKYESIRPNEINELVKNINECFILNGKYLNTEVPIKIN